MAYAKWRNFYFGFNAINVIVTLSLRFVLAENTSLNALKQVLNERLCQRLLATFIKT